MNHLSTGGTLVVIVGGIIGIIGVAAIIVAYFRASYAKATIDTLKDSNSALTERVEILEGENERCGTRISSLETENSNLKSYVSGTEAITGLQTAMTAQLTGIAQMLADVKGMIK